MSDEITVSAALAFNSDGRVASMQRVLDSHNSNGNNHIRRSQAIGNAAEALDVGELNNCGYALFYHTGQGNTFPAVAVTDTISLRMGAAGANFVTLDPGDISLVKLAGNTPYAISSALNAPVLEYLIVPK